MVELNPFRQVDEKHVLAEVKLMIWSPKMDLIAVASVAGEVVLHRLAWQKVWTLPAIGENIKVQAMAWRPDGKVNYSYFVGVHFSVFFLINLTLKMRQAVKRCDMFFYLVFYLVRPHQILPNHALKRRQYPTGLRARRMLVQEKAHPS